MGANVAGVDADRLSIRTYVPYVFRSARSVDITVDVFRSVRGAVGPPPLSPSISSLSRRFWASPDWQLFCGDGGSSLGSLLRSQVYSRAPHTYVGGAAPPENRSCHFPFNR